METAEHEGKVLRKRHITTHYSAVGDNGHTYSLTKHTSSASYRMDASPANDSNVDDESKLRSRGIEIVETDAPRFEKVSPEQVADYYKSLGDWQNVLPKTDYTYSPVSRFYRKKFNGVIPIIPNMSRREIRRSCEMLDNEINLYRANNYAYEETLAGPSAAFDGVRASPRDRLPDAAYLTPPLSSAFSADSRSLATASRMRYMSADPYDYYNTQTHHHRYQSSLLSSTRWTSGLTLLSTAISSLYSLTRYTYSKVCLFVSSSSTLAAAAAATTTTATATASTRTSSHHKSRSTRSIATFWKWFLITLLVLLLCACIANVSGDSNVSAITAPVSKSYSFVSSLVFSVYELTYSSVVFLASVISAAGGRLHDSVSTLQLAPLYHLIVLPLWRSTTSDESDATTSPIAATPTSALSSGDLDELFKRWLSTNGGDELAKKVVSSDEFVRFIDAKLQAAHQPQPVAGTAGDPLTLAKRVAELEAKFSRLESGVGDAATQTLQSELTRLRADIVEREKRLEKEVIMALSAMLGSGGQIVGADELRSRFTALFASVEGAWRRIEQLELQFVRFAENSTASFDAHFERTTRDLKHDLRLSVEELVAKKLAEWRASGAGAATAGGQPPPSPPADDSLEAYVKGVVRKALEVYDADKTGLADYALESSGGIVLSTRCTETKTANAQFYIFGIPLWHTSRSPRTVIQPGVHPGECWPFPGSNGYLVIQLSERIFVTGVTLEHIPRSLAPNGTIDSAPKDFSVWALRSESDPEPQPLGEFRFEMDGPSLQYFETNRLPEPYQIVELKILSNHGKLDYTCLYRFRVHGMPA